MILASLANSPVDTTREYWRKRLDPKSYLFLDDVAIQKRKDRITKRIAAIPKEAAPGHWYFMIRIARQHIENKSWPDPIFWERHIALCKKLWRRDLGE
jgi:hypothetical protein